MASTTTVRSYYIRTPMGDRVAALHRLGGDQVTTRTTGMFTYTKRERLIQQVNGWAIHCTFTTEERG